MSLTTRNIALGLCVGLIAIAVLLINHFRPSSGECPNEAFAE